MLHKGNHCKRQGSKKRALLCATLHGKESVVWQTSYQCMSNEAVDLLVKWFGIDCKGKREYDVSEQYHSGEIAMHTECSLEDFTRELLFAEAVSV